MLATPDSARNVWMRLFELWRLVGFADAAAKRALARAIAISALAASAEIGSLFLVQHAATLIFVKPVSGQGAPTGVLLALIATMMLSSLLRLLGQRSIVTAQYAIATSLGVLAFSRLQHQDYAAYLDSGASRAFAAFEELQIVCYNALVPMIAGVVSLATCALLLIVLTVLYPIAGLAVIGTSGLMLAIALGVRRRGSDDPIPALGRQRARLVYEARTAFRDICLTNGQDRMIADFAKIERTFRGRLANTAMAGQTARSEIEIIGLAAALIAVLAFPLVATESRALIPALGVLAIAGFRLLPHLASIRAAASQVMLHGDVTASMTQLLEPAPAMPEHAHAPALQLSSQVGLSGITMARDDRPDTLCGIDLVIPRGRRVGIVGASGSGKSTLLDILCGLLPPTEGSIRVDDQAVTPANAAAWRDRIGVVSQNALLVGDTLRQAICYPAMPEDADAARIGKVVAQTGLESFASSLAQGLDTPLGEATAKLSGGQRQRLALAHALYRARDLLVLDEATSQLDLASEGVIRECIDQLPRDLAIVLVTHRPALIDCCDEVHLLEDGRLKPFNP